jgi:hypothetical protein
MRIDIDGLSEAELIDLNNRVVERLKFLRHMRAHSQMLEFSIGDRVSFQPEGRPLQVVCSRVTTRKRLRLSPKAASTGTSLRDCCAALIALRVATPTLM